MEEKSGKVTELYSDEKKKREREEVPERGRRRRIVRRRWGPATAMNLLFLISFAKVTLSLIGAAAIATATAVAVAILVAAAAVEEGAIGRRIVVKRRSLWQWW